MIQVWVRLHNWVKSTVSRDRAWTYQKAFQVRLLHLNSIRLLQSQNCNQRSISPFKSNNLIRRPSTKRKHSSNTRAKIIFFGSVVTVCNLFIYLFILRSHSYYFSYFLFFLLHFILCSQYFFSLCSGSCGFVLVVE